MTKGLLFTLCLLVFLAAQVSDEIPVSGDSTLSISVPNDYPTIQSAIDNAVSGDTVFVSAGLYYERVTVNKTLTLVGDNWGTVLDGSNMGTLIRVTADNVEITGFKLQNSGWKWGRAGVEIYNADNCVIEDNFVYLTCHQIRLVESQGSKVVSNIVSAPSNPFPQSAYGIRLENCTDCLVIDNNVSNNIGGIHFEGAVNCTATGNYVFQNSQGIRLYSPCINNKIVGNTVFNNTNDGMLVALPNNTTFLQNAFYHNNFINNSQSFIGNILGCLWDNGYEGNYWSDYVGTDADGDGIGDTPHAIDVDNRDHYPLMHLWSPLPVRNMNTGSSYATIQEAIDAPQTLEGHTLSASPGIYSEHLTIHKSLRIIGNNCEATIIDGGDFGTVVHITANDVSFSGFTVRNGGNSSVDFLNSGIFVDYCDNVTLSNNKVANCRYGVYLFHSADNRLTDNNVSSNYEDGIWLYYSGNNILERNTIASNKYNFGVFGQDFSDFNNVVDTSNLVDDRPIRYEIGRQDKVFDSKAETSTLYLINANNVTVRDLHLSGNGNGVFLWNATNCEVENVTASENNYGIFLKASNKNVVRGNSCPNNWVGIFLEGSDQNRVEGNLASNNEKGISLYDSGSNILEGNTVSENLYGIRLFGSSSNRMCHNNLVVNTEQIDLVNSYNNDLDDGSEGNFWSDYTGLDTNEDGIGDSTHHAGGEQDRHPLMGRFQQFEVPLDQETFHVSIVCSSLINGFSSERTGNENTSALEFNVTSEFENQGFCRMSIPTALLRGPYVVKTYDLFWRNITFSTLPSTSETCTLLYFKYNSSVHSIAVFGLEPSPSGFLGVYVTLTLAGVLIVALIILYFAAKKRITRTKIVK